MLVVNLILFLIPGTHDFGYAIDAPKCFQPISLRMAT